MMGALIFMMGALIFMTAALVLLGRSIGEHVQNWFPNPPFPVVEQDPAKGSSSTLLHAPRYPQSADPGREGVQSETNVLFIICLSRCWVLLLFEYWPSSFLLTESAGASRAASS